MTADKLVENGLHIMEGEAVVAAHDPHARVLCSMVIVPELHVVRNLAMRPMANWLPSSAVAPPTHSFTISA